MDQKICSKVNHSFDFRKQYSATYCFIQFIFQSNIHQRLIINLQVFLIANSTCRRSTNAFTKLEKHFHTPAKETHTETNAMHMLQAILIAKPYLYVDVYGIRSCTLAK